MKSIGNRKRFEAVYDDRLMRVQKQRENALDLVWQEMEIKVAGWEAFECGESLDANPYKFNEKPDKSNYWEAGWEMAKNECTHKIP